jgi:predicted Zn-dependent peptidase
MLGYVQESRLRRPSIPLALLLAALALPAQDLKQFEKNVTAFTLPNGLQFIVMERHQAPVVSFHTYVNAGSVDDPSGRTGIAHMFEHMAFKGTETIGTLDWPAEKKAIEEVESVYDRLEAERNKGVKADGNAVAMLETQVRMAIDRAQAYVDPNQFSRIVEENGGAGLNAATGLDSTEYYCSLPSNRIELWFLLESQRFLRPVFREFYKERDVVMEEYRMRVESSPEGKLLQEFGAAAFEAHPYRNPPVGWPADIANLRRADAREFFEKYYVPANMTIAIVGDVDPAEAKRMAERYFGPLAARPLPPLLHAQEPPQPGPRTALVESPAQPLLVFGYQRPDQYDKDDPVFDLLAMILSAGRTSWIYRELVEDKRIALAAQAIPTYPNGRYPNLFVFFVAPAQGHGVDENLKAMEDLLERFKAQKVDAATLARVKAQARVQVLRRLADNAELAALLATYQAGYGDWRKLFTTLDDYAKVTADDVQRVARQYLAVKSRTLAYTTPPFRPAQPAAKGGRP